MKPSYVLALTVMVALRSESLVGVHAGSVGGGALKLAVVHLRGSLLA